MFDSLEIIYGVLFFAFAIQLCYWIYYAGLIGSIHSRESEGNLPPVSVIVIVNQSHLEWINDGIKELFLQDYPNYEVVVVNDCGGEELTMLLKRMSYDYPILRYTEIYPDRKFSHTEKVAKLVGIKCAKYENLVFFEPWSCPSSHRWLSTICSDFVSKDEVIGMSIPVRTQKLWTDIAMSFSCMSLIRSSRAAVAGRPYYASRTNFGFTKKVFYGSRGYNYPQTGYGDNDLYLRKIAKRGTFSVVLQKDGMVLQTLPEKFSEWFEDISYSLSVSRHYPVKVKLGLIFYNLSLAVFWFLLLFIGICCHENPILLLSLALLFVIRQSLVYAVYSCIFRKLSVRSVLGSFILYDLVSPILETVFYCSRKRVL